MSEPSGKKTTLQQFGFAESQYDRPNQPWVCGRLCDGRPCHIGPDAKGNCLATSECHPVRKGDRWHCTRPPSRGGSCESGPLPDGSCCKPVTACQPVRSVRSKRGQFVFWTVAGTLGITAAILFSPWRMKFIQPGELTTAHGQVLKDPAKANCSACHTAAFSADDHAGSSPEDWLKSALGASTSAIAESENCLKCHSATPGLRANPMNPHSVQPDLLARLTQKAQPAARSTGLRWTLASVGPDVPQTHDKQIACATCHVEHRGQDHQLAHMSNQQCQACHTTKFTSLASGHPDFTSFPYDRRTRIIFDHAGHQSYFTQKNAAFDCASCHRADVSGHHMLSAGFEKSCASCHAQPMESPSKGLAILHLPGVDVDALKEFAEEGGAWMGNWPKGADYDIDGKLSPFMRLLLSADPKVAEALAAIPPKMQLNDLTKATKEQKAAAVRIVWGVKELFHDLATRGQEGVRERLSAALGVTIDANQLADLTAELSADTVSQAQQRWLPDVLETVPLYRAGKPIPGAPVKKVAPPVPPPPPQPNPQPKPKNLFDDDEPSAPPTPAPPKPKPKDLFDDAFNDQVDPTAVFARVVGVKGNVQVRVREGEPWRPAKVGDELLITAEVRTSLNSAVQFRVRDVRTITVDRMSVMKVGALASDAGIKTDVGMKYGRTRYDVDVHDAKIHTPGTTLHVGSGPHYYSGRWSSDGTTKVVIDRPAMRSDATWIKDWAPDAPVSVQLTPRRAAQPPLLLALNADIDVSPKSTKKKPSDLFDDDEPAPPKTKPADKKSGDLFDDDEPAKPATKPPPPVTQPKKPDLFDDDDDAKKPAPPVAPVTPVTPKVETTPPLPPEKRVSAGGWYLDDSNFMLRYRPVGHANAFLMQWLNVTGSAAATPKSGEPSLGKAAFDALRIDAGATCVKCHSVDARSGEALANAKPDIAGLALNWRAQRPAADARPFVKFNHRPHRSLPELKDCTQCHAVAKTDVAAKYRSLDPHDFDHAQPGFSPLSVQKCAGCHQPNLAGDSCLKCHNYHISEVLRR